MLGRRKIRSCVLCTLAALALAGTAAAESLSWRRLGGSGVAAGLAGPAGGSVQDVWFSANGRTLYASLQGGGIWASADLGLSWERADSAAADFRAALESARQAGGSTTLVRNPYRAGVAYALGEHLYRSDDGGGEWTNLTAIGGNSLIGRWQSALAISPTDADVIVVGNSMGLWKSHDAGVTWSSLNARLPNFPAARFLATSPATAPSLAAPRLGTLELIRTAAGRTWRATAGSQPAGSGIPLAERTDPSITANLLPAGYAVTNRVWRDGKPVSPSLTACASEAGCAGHAISAFAVGNGLWAGTSNGNIWVSPDGGANWERVWSDPWGAAVTSLWTGIGPQAAALATAGGRILRSTNGGRSWFDITSDLPDSSWSAVQGHPEASAVYVAGPLGIYFANVDLAQPGPAGSWSAITGNLPGGSVDDLAIEPSRGRLYATVPGFGVYWANAPRLDRALRALSSADLAGRPAAPGGLLTIFGTEALSARAAGRPAPILEAARGRTQLQVPFAVKGDSLRLQLEAGDTSHVLDLPLAQVSPAVFIVDGEPLILDASTGALVGWHRPAKAGGNVLIMMAGLGAVHPPWPAGMPSPNSVAPRPVAKVQARLGGVPAKVASMQLAPGYVGMYLVELAIPATATPGEAQLVIEADGQPSNSVGLVIGR